MKVLFVTFTPFLSEPLGAMLLSAICRREGHRTKLTVAEDRRFGAILESWAPEVIAYSAMTTEIPSFRTADEQVRQWARSRRLKPFRIMGGPHPTFSPGILDELKLDAICQGDGDRALPTLLRRLEDSDSLEGIPNIGLTGAGAASRELFEDLDGLPFSDREDYYQAVPYCRASGLRSFMASRGCPYHCTYCFNHVFNGLFRGCGPIVRRRSVDHLIAEIEHVVKTYPPVRQIRFGDDTFAHRVDPWLEEFVEKYPKRIGIPFYCLMRSNTLTDDTARLLVRAGCRSISMSLESGSERVRNEILKRNLSDDVVIRSFETAKRHGLRVFANTMLGIPGTTLADDFQSLRFARRVKPTAPSFTICCPYPGTEIWDQAVKSGQLEPGVEVRNRYQELSVLKTYTQREKETQARMCYLGAMFCCVPCFLLPLVSFLIKSRFPLRLANYLGMSYVYYRLATRILPQAIPRTPSSLLALIRDTFRALGRRSKDGETSPIPDAPYGCLPEPQDAAV